MYLAQLIKVQLLRPYETLKNSSKHKIVWNMGLLIEIGCFVLLQTQIYKD